MEVLLFEPEYFNRHYNCNFYSVDSVPLEARQHKIAGFLFLIGYVIFTPIYSLCVWAMCAQANRQMVTYRIMIMLGIIHIIGLQETGLINGILAINGIGYCQSPIFIYITSLLASGTWTSSSVLSIILGLNRCTMLFNRSIHDRLFDGYRVIPWLLGPALYGLWIVIFTPGIIYSPIYVAFFFNPYQGYFDDPTDFYHSTPNRIHNFAICIFESLVYIVLIGLYKRSSRDTTAENRLKGRYDRQIYIQVLLVGLTSIIASGIYFVLLTFPMPISFSLVGTAFFHLSQGMPAIVYLCFNKTIRTTLSKRLRIASTVSITGKSTTQVQPIRT
ncbi:hypothetical protein M3Y94_00019100 [Aphelenchoides besseyi]|nr:hypothetical protein M3Y94_00019100 [Aphelenchoides besseyi]KAI6216506.1 hypothetical protein M3Y95_01272100 [Aphelenchoides besseyi]